VRRKEIVVRMRTFIRFGINIVAVSIVFSFFGCNPKNIKPSEDGNEHYSAANHLFYTENDIEQALVHYEKISQKTQLYPIALIQRCRLNEQLENWIAVREVVKEYDSIQERFPYLSHFFLSYAVKSALGMYDYTEIAQYERKAMSIEDDYFKSSVLLGVARLYELNGKNEDALRIYRILFPLRARAIVRATIREQYRIALFSHKYEVTDIDCIYASALADKYPEEIVYLLTRTTERSEHWWAAYAALPEKHRFPVEGSEKNGYVGAHSIRNNTSSLRKTSLDKALSDPQMTMIKPLALLALHDYFSPDYFYRYYTLLNNNEYDHVCQNALRYFLLSRDFNGLRNFLSTLSYDRFSPQRKAHYLFWQGYSVLNSSHNTTDALAYFEYSISENPNSYYHQVISDLTDIPFAVTTTPSIQHIPETLTLLLEKLSEYSDYETIHAIQESLDDSFFRDTYSLFLPIYARTHQTHYMIEASAHLSRIFHIETELIDWFYPITLNDELTLAATHITLPDVSLLRALMHQESSFRIDARSRVGATGLMQVMPTTAKPFLKKYFPDNKTPDLSDPVVNIVCGTAYLNILVARYGKIEYALGAYNGGPGRMNSWIKEFGDRPIVEFVELIPYDETRDYIKSVLKKHAIYTHLSERK